MNKAIWLLLVSAVLAHGFFQTSQAAGELHLNFHMGGAVGGHSFVGGTLKNTGDAPVAHGYVVVTVLDGKCRPVKSILESFGNIAAGEALGFRVPVNDLKRYRLAVVKGFDTDGFEVVSIDDNAELLKGREAQEREDCTNAQQALVPQ